MPSFVSTLIPSLPTSTEVPSVFSGAGGTSGAGGGGGAGTSAGTSGAGGGGGGTSFCRKPLPS
ncbi:hypothetical protein [Flavobacterium sp. 3HN19-14]|uniref:hypothetical protein n=1 Tax=Flavobacterium sp. 3HN19-14 TaxID=3448133 RepID=UPI003EDEB81F